MTDSLIDTFFTFHHYRTKQRNKTTGAVYSAGNVYPSGALDFTPDF